MESKSVFLFVSLLPILFGVFILIAVIKNWGKDMTPRRLVYKIIRETIGEKGTRIFGGLAGIGLILYGVFIFSTMYLGYNPFSKKDKQTDNISIEKKTVIDANTTTSSTLYLTIPTLEQNVKLGGESILKEYVKVSFRNNHITSIPDIVWKMRNLEEIDLTNNKISKLSLENLKNLNNLKVIILTGNPIDKSEIDRLRKEMNIEIKY
jgi:Leucine-rich repeat (LRR) protein